ncbi:hypothetical protein GO730_04220 [Spirosoma sp. HMF3257]|uniref:Transposase DDE domain-containing protein n=1 Tax=Spirosoma telluris TaxID=2183553 RepID=A0A327NF10_9BACT|nr:hypothetical protein [Spirosoma telluris]RAI73802.1 hypothetical protein HMF3257_04185 [Spirosoma telluris]
MANFEIAKPTKLPPDGYQCYAKTTLFYPRRQPSLKSRKSDPKAKTPKDKYRLTNWPDYNKALINRGFVTLWLDDDTLAKWYFQGARTPGRLIRYSDQCIQAALALKALFQLAFRQIKELIQSLLSIMKMDLQVPSYSQLCRRQASLFSFSAPVAAEDSPAKLLHIVIDSTGLKVYGEGDRAARAVEGQ